MATTPLVPIVSAYNLSTAWQDIYTVPTATERVGIDAVVFNNYSISKVEISVRIIQAGASTDLNEIITNKTIRAESNDLAPSLIGQSLVSGGIIQAKCNTNSAVNVNITATTVTK